MRKMIAALLVLVMLTSLSACGFTTTSTTTTTENGVTTTTTTTTENGKTTTTTTVEQAEETLADLCQDGSEYTFKLIIENSADVDIAGFYVTEAGAPEYYNILDEGEVIAAQGSATFDMTVGSDYLVWDFGILPEDSEDAVWFEGVDLSMFAPENDSIEFAQKSDGWHLYY